MTDAPKPYQFSLGRLMMTVLYASFVAASTIRFVGAEWSEAQKAAAYLTTVSLLGGFAFAVHFQAKLLLYVIISPLVFIVAVCVAGMIGNRSDSSQTVISPIPRSTPLTSPTLP